MPSASMFIAIDGGAEKLAGRHEASKTAIAESVLGAFFPDAQDVRSDVVGQQFVPNVEALLAADPEVVFQWANPGEDVIGRVSCRDSVVQDVQISVVAGVLKKNRSTLAWSI